MSGYIVEIEQEKIEVQIEDGQNVSTEIEEQNSVVEVDEQNVIVQIQENNNSISIDEGENIIVVQETEVQVVEVGVTTLVDASITGKHPVIGNPRNVQELADSLEETYKSYFNASQATTLWLDQDNGDDNNDGLTQATALQSIQAVVQRVHDVYSTAQVVCNVVVASSHYTVPFGYTGLKNLRFLGVPVVEETRNVVTSIAASNDYGVEFTVDGPQLAEDEWAGRILHVVNLHANQRNIGVVRNSWNGSANVIYGAMHQRNFLGDAQTALTSAADVNLLKLPEFRFPGASVISNVIDLNFEYIHVSGGSIFMNGAAKPQWIRCQISCAQIIAGNSGSAPYILSSTIANVGTANNGILAARSRGVMRLGYGTVYIDTRIGNTDNMKLVATEGGSFEWEGGGIFRGLSSEGIGFNGSNSYPFSAQSLKLIFENQSGTPSNVAAWVFNGADVVTGEDYGVPESHGAISGDNFVSAKAAAHVRINPNSSVTTALGTNTVSADGGTTLCSSAVDGTRILGGTPAFDGGMRLPQLSADPVDPPTGQSVIWQSDGTGLGDDGDVMIKITNSAGNTKVGTLIDYSNL